MLEVATAFAPGFWLFAALLVPIGMFGLTVNVTANASVQTATDPEMRGRVMALFMMVFSGGTPIGAPLVGWVTDTYGARIGMAAGGAASLAAAGAIAVVLSRVGNLRLSVGRHGVAFVPTPEGRLVRAAA